MLVKNTLRSSINGWRLSILPYTIKRRYSNDNKNREIELNREIKQIMKKGKYDISEVKDIDLVKKEIIDMTQVEEFDDLVDTYKRDTDSLYSADRFSRALGIRQKLLLVREENRQREKRDYTIVSGVAVCFVSVLLCGILIFIYDFESAKVKVPVYFDYWRTYYKAIQLDSEVRSKMITDLNEKYFSKSRELGLANGEIDLNVFQSMSEIPFDSEYFEKNLNYIYFSMESLKRNRKLYILQLDPIKIINIVSLNLNNLKRAVDTGKIDNKTSEEIIDFSFEFMLDYFNQSLRNRTFMNTIMLMSVYCKHKSRGKLYSKSQELDQLLETLRKDIESSRYGPKFRGRDSSIIKYDLHEYLLKRLT